MTQEQADAIGIKHNVWVDAESEQYNRTGPDEVYGWEPVPIEWTEYVDEQEVS